MNTNKHSRPLWAGFVASILSVPVLVTVFAIIFSRDIWIPLIMLIVGVMITSLVTLFGTIPMVLWLRKRGQLNSLPLFVLGTVLGAISMGLTAFNLNYSPIIAKNQSHFERIIFDHVLPSSLIGGVFGLISMVAFCIGAGLSITPIRPRSDGQH